MPSLSVRVGTTVTHVPGHAIRNHGSLEGALSRWIPTLVALALWIEGSHPLGPQARRSERHMGRRGPGPVLPMCPDRSVTRVPGCTSTTLFLAEVPRRAARPRQATGVARSGRPCDEPPGYWIVRSTALLDERRPDPSQAAWFWKRYCAV